MTLAEGDYIASPRNDGQVYQSEFRIRSASTGRGGAGPQPPADGPADGRADAPAPPPAPPPFPPHPQPQLAPAAPQPRLTNRHEARHADLLRQDQMPARQTYQVATALADARSPPRSIRWAGEYDIQSKFHIDDDVDIGHISWASGCRPFRASRTPDHDYIQGLLSRAGSMRSSPSPSRGWAPSAAGFCLSSPAARPDSRIAAVAARYEAKARALLLTHRVKRADSASPPLPQAARYRCRMLPAACFDEIADATLAAGKGLKVLLRRPAGAAGGPDPRFRAAGQRLIVPTGAILGRDVTPRSARGDVSSVRIVTRKSPSASPARRIRRHRPRSAGPDEPTLVFSGTAREAIRGFPRQRQRRRRRSRWRASAWTGRAATSGRARRAANIHEIEIETPGASVRMANAGRPDPPTRAPAP